MDNDWTSRGSKKFSVEVVLRQVNDDIIIRRHKEVFGKSIDADVVYDAVLTAFNTLEAFSE